MPLVLHASGPVRVHVRLRSWLDHPGQLGVRPACRGRRRAWQSRSEQRPHRAERVRLQPQRRLRELDARAGAHYAGSELRRDEQRDRHVLALAQRRVVALRPCVHPRQQQRADVDHRVAERPGASGQRLDVPGSRHLRYRGQPAHRVHPVEHGTHRLQLGLQRLEHRRRDRVEPRCPGRLLRGRDSQPGRGPHRLRRPVPAVQLHIGRRMRERHVLRRGGGLRCLRRVPGRQRPVPGPALR